MSAAKLWADALKEYGNAFEVPRPLLIEIVNAYREENFEGANSPTLNVPDDLLAALLHELQAKKLQGRKPPTLTERRDIDSVIRKARIRKANLIKDGMRKGEAHATALQWAVTQLHDIEGLPIASTTISKRLYGKA